MKKISPAEIEEVWEHHCGLDEAQSREVSKRFLDQQPALGMYLLVCDEQLEDEALESQLVPLALTIWEVMTKANGRPLKQVQTTRIERAEEANIAMLKRLEAGSEVGMHSATGNLLKEYNQAPLLGFCLEILMLGNEETPELAPNRLGMELLWLKTVIDCFDR
jgi:hypothetical protein